MCLLCDAAWGTRRLARRANVLQLLSLIEHPDALPTESALRVARQILALTEAEPADLRCAPVSPPGPLEMTMERRRS